MSAKSNYILAAGISLCFFGLYLSTMPLVNVGYQDSDLLITLAARGGVGLPPGYPLYLSLLHLFQLLPLTFLTVAGRSHLLSVLLSALTLGITFLGLTEIYDLIPIRKKILSEKLILAGIGTLTLGFSGLFWLYGEIAEKYVFSAFLVALFYFLYAKFLRIYRRILPLIYLTGLGLILGLSLAHQQLLVLLLPGFLYSLYLVRRRLSLFSVALSIVPTLAGFFGSMSLILLLHRLASPISWPVTDGLTGLVKLVSQGDILGATSLSQFLTNGNGVNQSLEQGLLGLLKFAQFIFSSVGWWLIPVFIISVISVFTIYKKRYLSFFLTGSILFLGVPLYFSWPTEWGNLSRLVPNLLPGLVVLPYLLFPGLLISYQRLNRFIAVLVSPRATQILMGILIAAILIIQGLLTYPQVNLHRFTLVRDRYQQMWQAFASNSVVTCYSDMACNALLFEKFVSHPRLDVEVIPLAYPLVQTTLARSDLKGFTYEQNPFLLMDIISWNLDRRPVYAVEVSDYYYKNLGFDYPNLFYIPYGYYGELTRRMPQTLPDFNSSLSEAWLKVPTIMNNPMQLQLKSTPARDHLFNGLMFNQMGLIPRSLTEFNEAANLYYSFSVDERRLFDDLRLNLEQSRYDPKFAPGSSVPNSADLLKLIPHLIEAKLNGQAYKAALAVMMIDPRNLNSHLALAAIFEKMGDLGFAKKEYQHTLLLDSRNVTAIDRLAALATQSAVLQLP